MISEEGASREMEEDAGVIDDDSVSFDGHWKGNAAKFESSAPSDRVPALAGEQNGERDGRGFPRLPTRGR